MQSSEYYPIFINWRSGPVTTYLDHLARIRQGRISPTAKITSPLYLATDLAQSIVGAPKAWLIQGLHSVQAMAGKSETGNGGGPNQDQVYYTADNAEENGHARELAWAATAPIKLLTTPFAHELPKPAWNMMNRRISTLFHETQEYYPKGETPDTYSSLGNGALSLLLQRMAQCHYLPKPNNQPTPHKGPTSNHKKSYEVTLVGHSMGTIVINQLLRTFHDYEYEKIIYMGAAASIDESVHSLGNYLAKHENSNFFSLMLHPDNENWEENWGGTIPDGSLLVKIDESYDEPRSETDRTFGRWTNIQQARHLFPETVRENGQMHYKIFGIGQLPQNPQKHGEFGDLTYWKQKTYWK